MKLDNLRKKIDEIDWQLLILLKKRLGIARKIAIIKDKIGLPIEVRKREKKILNSLTEKGDKLKLSQSFISNLFNLIISESKRIQEK